MNFADLVLGADTRGLDKGVKSLDNVVVAGGKAEKSVDHLGDEFKQTGNEAAAAGAKIKGAATATTAMSGAAVRAAAGLTAMVGGYVSMQAIGGSVRMARDFNSVMAETSTLIEGTPQQMAMLSTESKRLAASYGGSATAQVKAFYQAISAGADGVTGATKLLDAANKLAVGGVTDVTTAVDALTTATNAYAAQGLAAGQASDAMFVGMKLGKTTIGELAASLGQIVPLASAAGVSFDEVVAGVSALTTQGQTTAMATTGLRQVIASVIKPTKQAADMAAELGIAFDAQALKSQGLASFLDDVIDKTDGNTESMAGLFGSVEALNAALAFAGGAGANFNEILDQMGHKAGATDVAFGKLAGGVDQRLNKAMGAMRNLSIEAGNALLTGLVPAVEAFASGMGFMSDKSDVLLTVLTGLTVSIIPNMVLSLGAMATTMGVVTAAATRMAVAMWAATGPWGVLAGLVAGTAAYFTLFAKEAEKVPDPIEESKKALDDLNTQLAVFGTTYAPTAATGALQAANAYVQLADSIHNTAVEQVALFRTELGILKAQEAAGTNFFAAREAELMGPDYEAAMQEAARAELNLETARNRRIQTAKLVMTADNGMAAAQKKLNGEVEVTIDGVNNLGGGMKDTVEAAKELTGELDGPLRGSVDGVAGAFGDFMTGSLNSFTDFREAIVSSFKRMISQMIAIAAKNQIMIGLGLGGSVAQAGAGAAVSGGGGNGILTGLLGGKLLGGGGFLSGVGSGLGGVLSGGGLASSFANLGGLATGSVGLTGGAIGAVIPALGVLGGAVALLAKGLSKEYKGTALRGTLGTDGFDGTQFDFYKGGFLRGNDAVYKGVPDEIQGLLDTASGAMSDSIRDMASDLNLGADAVKNFTGTEFTIWMNGLDEAGIQEALAGKIAYASSEMAELVLTTDEWSRSGENALDTMTRLSGSLNAANDAADLLGHRLFASSLMGADAASTLVDAFGGLEAMSAAVGVYWQGFYSEQERTETTIRRLTEGFEALGVAMPQSREGFREMVEGIDATTESGAELYAELMLMSGALSDVLPQVAAFTLSMSGILSQIDSEIQLQIASAQGFARDSKSAAQLWYRTATTLRSFLSDLLNTDLSLASQSQTAYVNRNRFDMAVEMAKGGDVDAARDLPGLTKSLLTSLRDSSSSEAEYRRAAADVQSQVRLVAGISDLEGANDDILLALYTQQIDVLTSLGNFLQLEGISLDLLDESVRSLVENWDGTRASFSDNLEGLAAAIEDAQNFSYANVVADLDIAIALASAANIPDWLQALAEKTGSNLKTTLDFIIGQNDLTAPMLWIAVNEISTHTKNLAFVLTEDLSDANRRLALATDSDLQRNLILILAADLDADTKMIALAGNSDLTRAVLVTLNKSSSNPKALKLALNNIGDYAAHVYAVLDTDKFSKRTRRIVLKQQGTYAALVEAAVGLVEDDPVAARILLRQQGEYIAEIGATLSGDLSKKQKRLLLNAVTTAARIVTISAVFPDGLTKVQKAMLTASGGRIDQIIDAYLEDGSISDRGWRFLKRMGSDDSKVVQTIKGKVDLSELSTRQKTLLDAITGASEGKITLGGQFTFNPGEAFKTYFSEFATGENAMVAGLSGVSASMDVLGGLLNDLGAAVDADRQQRADQVTASNIYTQVDKIQANVANRVDKGADLESSMAALLAKYGVSAYDKDTGKAVTDLFSVGDGGSLVGDWYLGGATGQTSALKGDSEYSALWARIKKLNKYASISADNLQSGRDQLESLGIVPSFAGGGYTGDGPRSGGLDGKGGFLAMLHKQETVTDHTKGSGDSALLAELQALRVEIAGMRDEQRQLGLENVKHGKRNADIQRKWDAIGLPVEQTA